VIERVRVSVLVDDFVGERGARRGLVPLHGLCLHIEARCDDGSRWSLLVDGGPLADVLLHNAAAMGVKVEDVRAAVGTMWSAHHVGALLGLAGRGLVRGRLHLPPLPKQEGEGFERVEVPGAAILSLPSPVYRERLLLLEMARGYVAIVPCSVYGIDVPLGALRELEGRASSRVVALIGGFNVSSFSRYDVRLLLKFARERGAQLIPLHSTSIEARERICRAVGLDEIPGAGDSFVIE